MKEILNPFLKRTTHVWCYSLGAFVICLISVISPSCQKEDLLNQASLDGKNILSVTAFPNNTPVVYYGHKIFTRSTGAPIIVTQVIENPNFNCFDENFVLKIKNGRDKKTRVSSAEILIDGVLIVGPSDFSKNVAIITKQLSGLTPESILEVKLNSTPGSFIDLWIDGAIIDSDGDGVPDATDNCPNTANSNQQDTDGDGIGDSCEKWGTLISGDVALTAGNLQSSSPSLLNISFDCDANYNNSLLSADAQTVFNDCSIGGSVCDSRSLAMEVLNRLANATLFSTESQIGYIDAAGKTTDMIVSIENLKVGIDVTKAYHYPPDNPYTNTEATSLLTRSLSDIQKESLNLSSGYKCGKYILLVFAYDSESAAVLSTALGSINPLIKSNTIVLVVTTDGVDSFMY